MPSLMDMFQPQDAMGQPTDFAGALRGNSNAMVGLGMGLLTPRSMAVGAPAQSAWSNALGGYQQGAQTDAANAYRQAQVRMEQDRLKLARQQANREPEALRIMRATGVDPASPEGRALLYPKTDEWKEGKVSYREQDYPYRANLRTGQYEWGPLGAPPGVGGAARPAAPGAAAPGTTGAGGAATTTQPEVSTQEPPKPAGYDTWLPSVQKEYDKTLVQQQAKRTGAEPEQKAQLLESGTVALREIDAALKQSEAYPNMVAGPFGNAMKNVWGSQAADVEKRLDVVKANIAFDKLQQMRRASPTGGALGNVSDKDMALLQNSLASLDQAQSSPQFLQALRNVQTHYRNVLAKIQGGPSSSSTTTGQTGGGVRKYNPQTGMIE